MPHDPTPLRPHPLLTHYYADEDSRRRQVLSWFDDSAADYDWINQAMSFGSGSRYRRQALLRAGLAPGMKALDVACGTGAVTTSVQEIAGPGGRALGLDPSTGMLLQARRHAVRRLVRGVAEALPFPDGWFDFLSMGYALRHVTDLRRTFEEYHRVLAPGGRLLILEVTPPRSRLPFFLLELYLGRIIPLVARLGRGGRTSRDLMRYYWETIEQCVPPPVILAALAEAGFKQVERHVEMAIFSEYVAVR
ncbi:MAG TPA: class I SAM-dependent methyltransferase [Thermoanaerobaculia bacterium]|nr:class I SAM-dependent methyltransferase [Thermoanaerobaculia bacterium]